LSNLKSKGLSIGGDLRTPITEVRGKVVAIEDKEVPKYDYEAKKTLEETETRVWLVMEDITVIATEDGSTYPYSKTKLPIGKFSDYNNSAWYEIEMSIASVMGIDVDDASVDLLIEHVCHLRLDPKDYDIDGEIVTGKVWHVLEIEGAEAPVAPIDAAIAHMAVQPVRKLFKGEAVALPAVKKDTTLVNAILDDSFFDDPRVTSVYTEVEGKFVAV
jgi:hypothetical protein